MNQEPDKDALLAGSPVDAGCAASFEVLHEYVEEELAGGQPERRQPGMAAHPERSPEPHGGRGRHLLH